MSFFPRIRLAAALACGVIIHVCCVWVSAAVTPKHWIAEGKLRWREPVAAGQASTKPPKNLPAIVPAGTPAWPVLRIINNRGEELEFTAAIAVRMRWSEAVHRAATGEANPADAESGCELAVWKVMAKRGPMIEQLELRGQFEREIGGASAGLRRTMMVWPVWVPNTLCVGPLRGVQSLPSLAELDAVAKRWSLDAFDGKCVALVQEMIRRNALVLGMLKNTDEPFSHEFVEQYVTSTEKNAPDGGPTYRQLIHSYATKLLTDVTPSASPNVQLELLDKALSAWQSGGVGFADIWTSLVTGELDCDALCLVAAEVLARRGWSVRFETTATDAIQQSDGVDIGHVILQIRPPRLINGAKNDQSGSETTELGDERLYDPSPFPVAQPQIGKEAFLSKHEWKFEPYTAAEAAANEAIVRGLIPVAK